MEGKWKLLYDYTRKAFDDEVERFSRVDEKATKFLTSISIIITLFVGLTKWLFSDSDNNFTICFFIIIGLAFFLLSLAWVCFFSSLRLTIVPKMPLTDEVFDLFKNEKINSIYFALHKSAKSGVEELSLIIHKKAKFILWGFRLTIAAGILMIFFICTVMAKSINFKLIFC